MLLYCSRHFASAMSCGCEDLSPPVNAETASDLPTSNLDDSFAPLERFEGGGNRRSERVD